MTLLPIEKRNTNGIAIFNNLLAHKGEVRAFLEIAADAHVEPKTKYLTLAEQTARELGYRIEKVENGVMATVVITTKFPNGLVVEREREEPFVGYRLVDNK